MQTVLCLEQPAQYNVTAQYMFRYQDEIVCCFNNQKQQSACLGQYPGASHTTVILP